MPGAHLSLGKQDSAGTPEGLRLGRVEDPREGKESPLAGADRDVVSLCEAFATQGEAPPMSYNVH